ncbi:MAG: hypothetical protein MRZ79_25840 [Bacteroidia bacterium]|nr:hypothetical protein [Bacteroidia bacterium]
MNNTSLRKGLFPIFLLLICLGFACQPSASLKDKNNKLETALVLNESKDQRHEFFESTSLSIRKYPATNTFLTFQTCFEDTRVGDLIHQHENGNSDLEISTTKSKRELCGHEIDTIIISGAFEPWEAKNEFERHMLDLLNKDFYQSYFPSNEDLSLDNKRIELPFNLRVPLGDTIVNVEGMAQYTLKENKQMKDPKSMGDVVADVSVRTFAIYKGPGPKEPSLDFKQPYKYEYLYNFNGLFNLSKGEYYGGFRELNIEAQFPVADVDGEKEGRKEYRYRSYTNYHKNLSIPDLGF